MEWKKITELFTGLTGGIRRRLLWIGLLFLALALLTNTIAGTVYTRVQIKRAAFEIQTQVASRVARRIEGFIERKVERLLDFAASASLHEFGDEQQRLLALLLLKNDLSFSEVAVLNQNGVEVLKVSERKVYLPRELLNQGEHEKFRNAFGGRNYISPVYTSEKAEPYVTVAVPIRVGPREIVGVVSAELNLKSLWQLVGDVGFGTAGYAYLVDSQGNLIAHKDPSLVLRRTNLKHIQKVREFLHNPTAIDPTPSEEKQGIAGKRVLSTFAPVRGLGWGVILEEPVELALADVRRMERYAFLLLGLGLLLGALVIVWVSDRITRPIRQFHKGVEIIGSGNLDYRLEIRSGDEIEELAQEFNEMAGELKSLYSTLEQKVEQRTRELSALYDVTTNVNQTLAIEPVLQGVIKKITEVFGFDATRIFLFDGEMKELHLRASFETKPEFFAHARVFKRGQGNVGAAAETGEPIIYEDVTADPRYQQQSSTKVARNGGFSFFATIPIKSERRTLGTLVCIGRMPRRLTSEEMRLLTSMAGQIGVAVERANLFEETVKRARELSALYDVTATVNQSMEAGAVLQEVIAKVLEIIGFDAARIYLLDPQAGELKLKAHQGISEDFASQTATDPVGVGITGSVLLAGKPAIFADIQTDPLYAERAGGGWAQEAGFHAYISLPLKSKTKTLGVMNFLSRQVREVSPKDIALLTAMAHQIGVAVENTNLYQQTAAKARELSALYDVTATVSQSLDLNLVLQEVIKEITEIFHFDTMRIYLLDPQTDELHVRAHYPTDRGDLARVSVFRRGQGIVGRVADTGEPMIFENLQNDPRYRELSHTKNTQKTGHRFFAAFPVKTKLKPIGAIVCNGRVPRSLRSDEARLLASIADQIGVAVENANLFAQVKNKSVELERTNTELQEANRAKADFLAAMSHELRTPLNVIIGNSDLLKDGFFGDVSDKQQEALEKVLRYSRNLLKLINDVLTLSRMEARKMSVDLSTFHLEDVLYHARTYVEQLNRSDRLKVVWQVEPGLPPITTDALKLEEILQNLIGNAFKFTPEGKIKVQVRNLRGKDRIEFSVADTGIGIEEKDLGRIFEPFHQLQEAHTGSYSGVGLGLNIIKCYLDLMQGEIRVESHPGKGTKFTFTLPRSIENRIQQSESSIQNLPSS